MDNQYSEYNENSGENNAPKKSLMWQWFKWIVYSVALMIIIIVIYRLISTSTPNELKNYLIKNDRIENAYLNLQDDFVIYKIDIRGAFSMGDAMFADSIYYLESAENFQLTLRCKNKDVMRRVKNYGESFETSEIFKIYLKVSLVDVGGGGSGGGEDGDEEGDGGVYDLYSIIEPSDVKVFGKYDDRYKYFVMSFDNVIIEDYAKVKIELFICDTETVTEMKTETEDYENYVARFTLFDVNMPKSKTQMKKFNLD